MSRQQVNFLGADTGLSMLPYFTPKQQEECEVFVPALGVDHKSYLLHLRTRDCPTVVDHVRLVGRRFISTFVSEARKKTD
jgi:hypothetical protein